MMALGSPQQASQSSRASSGPPPDSGAKESRMLQKYLTDCRSFYSCLYCRTHLANHDELISRSFQGNRSRAYLFNTVINIITGPAVQRELNTGSHAVADIFCSNCGTTIGWKYEKAYVDSQKYKEGKFIIELAHVVRENRHLELDKRDMFLGIQAVAAAAAAAVAAAAVAADSATAPNRARKDNGTGADRKQLHMGSLSPPCSNSAGSQWSSATSSSSSNEEGGPRLLSCDQDVADGNLSSEDEEDVLMFPFHDDLYGERASYSNLSASHLSYQRRIRRSLHLESTPYDWKYSAAPSASRHNLADMLPTSSSSLPSPLASTSRKQSPQESLSQSISTSASATRRPASPSMSAGRQRTRSPDGPGSENEPDEHVIQFKLDPCDSARPSSNTNCDQPKGYEETLRKAAPDGRSAEVPAARADERTEAAPGSGSAGRPNALAINSSGNSGDSTSSLSNSLGMEDEEFYDCCTDHQVSSTSALSCD